jgi:diketogulonate reductase-like aldo/keto reductase
MSQPAKHSATQTTSDVQGPRDACTSRLIDSSSSTLGQTCDDLSNTMRHHRYRIGKTRAIGVSNFCAACLECIATPGAVIPAVNQLQFHVGMPGTDPSGLLSYCSARGIVVQACVIPPPRARTHTHTHTHPHTHTHTHTHRTTPHHTAPQPPPPSSTLSQL